MSGGKNAFSGNTDILVLKLLSVGDMYGYEITSKLSELSNSVFDLKAGTLYPLLHLLEQNGYIESYEKQADSGKMRKYYHITKSGKSFLDERLTAWNSFSNAMNDVIGWN